MKRYIKRLLCVALAILIFLTSAFFIWAELDYEADKSVLHEASKNKKVTVNSTEQYIIITPLNYNTQKAYIFYGGAKVEPEAYISKLTSIAAETNLRIFIPRMPMNLAVFGIDKAKEIQNSYPGIKHWFIGGHSLGGSMACYYASKHTSDFDGILIFGTYSGSDLSHTTLKVMSINGEADGIFPLQEIKKHRNELPVDAKMIFIKGMNHAQIGNYGFQSGDNPSNLSDRVIVKKLIEATQDYFK